MSTAFIIVYNIYITTYKIVIDDKTKYFCQKMTKKCSNIDITEYIMEEKE